MHDVLQNWQKTGRKGAIEIENPTQPAADVLPHSLDCAEQSKAVEDY